MKAVQTPEKPTPHKDADGPCAPSFLLPTGKDVAVSNSKASDSRLLMDREQCSLGPRVREELDAEAPCPERLSANSLTP